MRDRIALVTGASGFIGRWVVGALRRRGVWVRAGIHRLSHIASFPRDHGVEVACLDLLDKQSLVRAMDGVDSFYHFAALIDPKAQSEDHFQINAEGTKNLWTCAAACSVRAALYCSSASVYGLLSSSSQPVTEDVRPRAVEPYGRSKLLGESTALEIGAQSGPATVVIRPVAVFGPGDQSPFGRSFRRAAVSRLLFAGAFRGREFSFVHVEDVAEAAVHLMQSDACNGQAYNVSVEDPISFECAFQAYTRALIRSGRCQVRARFLARLSAVAQKLPVLSHLLATLGGERLVFTVWQPGFDMTYSSEKLLRTSFQFKWTRFEDVVLSWINEKHFSTYHASSGER